MKAFYHLSTGLLIALQGLQALAQDGPCDRYTRSFYGSSNAQGEWQMITLLINTAFFGNYTGPGSAHPYLPGSALPVTGLLKPGNFQGTQVNLLPYFNGTLVSTSSRTEGNKTKPVSKNFLDGGGADAVFKAPLTPGNPNTNQARLLNHLYEYFGVLLGCSAAGKSDAFPAYSGRTGMFEVHKYMDLNNAEWGYFIQQFGYSAASFGISLDDITTTGTMLSNLFGYRCLRAAAALNNEAPELQSICTGPACSTAANAVCGLYQNVSAPATAEVKPAGPSATASPSGTAGDKNAAQKQTATGVVGGWMATLVVLGMGMGLLGVGGGLFL